MTPNNPSKPVSLEAEAVEAVAKALDKAWSSPETKARAAIHAFLDVMEVTVERTAAYTKGDVTVPAGTYIDYQPSPGWQETTPFYRLSCSRWFPIKGPVDE